MAENVTNNETKVVEMEGVTEMENQNEKDSNVKPSRKFLTIVGLVIAAIIGIFAIGKSRKKSEISLVDDDFEDDDCDDQEDSDDSIETIDIEDVEPEKNQMK